MKKAKYTPPNSEFGRPGAQKSHLSALQNAGESPKTATNHRKTAVNLRKTEANLRKTVVNPRKTAVKSRKISANLHKDAGIPALLMEAQAEVA